MRKNLRGHLARYQVLEASAKAANDNIRADKRDARKLPKEYRESMAFAYGAACSAWLVMTHREKFHMVGAVNFDIRLKDKLPLWFDVAARFLTKRKGWQVVYKRQGAKETYRVRWLGWNDRWAARRVR